MGERPRNRTWPVAFASRGLRSRVWTVFSEPEIVRRGCSTGCPAAPWSRANPEEAGRVSSRVVTSSTSDQRAQERFVRVELRAGVPAPGDEGPPSRSSRGRPFGGSARRALPKARGRLQTRGRPGRVHDPLTWKISASRRSSRGQGITRMARNDRGDVPVDPSGNEGNGVRGHGALGKFDLERRTWP